jgi:protease I
MHVRLLETEVTMTRALKNRRVAVLATDGFEKVELTIPVAALKAAGAEVDIVSLRHGRIRGVNLHEPASRVRVTCTIDEASPANSDALLVPGGFINPDLLRQSAAAREFVTAFNVARKRIATLCHGPWVLGSAGLLAGRTLTSWPGIRDDMVNAGAVWLDQEDVHDSNLVTSRGPQDMVPFVRAMLEHFAAAEASRPAEQHGSVSSPQRNEPPATVVNAMRWIPRPSIRTAVGLGVAAVAALAAVSRRAA